MVKYYENKRGRTLTKVLPSFFITHAKTKSNEKQS